MQPQRLFRVHRRVEPARTLCLRDTAVVPACAGLPLAEELEELILENVTAVDAAGLTALLGNPAGRLRRLVLDADAGRILLSSDRFPEVLRNLTPSLQHLEIALDHRADLPPLPQLDSLAASDRLSPDELTLCIGPHTSVRTVLQLLTAVAQPTTQLTLRFVGDVGNVLGAALQAELRSPAAPLLSPTLEAVRLCFLCPPQPHAPPTIVVRRILTPLLPHLRGIPIDLVVRASPQEGPPSLRACRETVDDLIAATGDSDALLRSVTLELPSGLPPGLPVASTDAHHLVLDAGPPSVRLAAVPSSVDGGR